MSLRESTINDEEVGDLQISPHALPEDPDITHTARAVLEHIQALGMSADARNKQKAGEINVPLGMIGGAARTFLEKPKLTPEGEVPTIVPYAQQIEKIVARMRQMLDPEGDDPVGFDEVKLRMRTIFEGVALLALDIESEEEATRYVDQVFLLESIHPDEYGRITEAQTLVLAEVMAAVYPMAAKAILRELSQREK